MKKNIFLMLFLMHSLFVSATTSYKCTINDAIDFGNNFVENVVIPVTGEKGDASEFILPVSKTYVLASIQDQGNTLSSSGYWKGYSKVTVRFFRNKISDGSYQGQYAVLDGMVKSLGEKFSFQSYVEGSQEGSLNIFCEAIN